MPYVLCYGNFKLSVRIQLNEFSGLEQASAAEHGCVMTVPPAGQRGCRGPVPPAPGAGSGMCRQQNYFTAERSQTEQWGYRADTPY